MNIIDGQIGTSQVFVDTPDVDVVDYRAATQGLVVTVATRRFTNYSITWDGAAQDDVSRVEGVIGSMFSDTMTSTVDSRSDWFDGGAGGADILDGGGGIDTVSYAFSQRGVVLDLAAQVAWDGAEMDSIKNFENVLGSPLADLISGTNGDNVIDGGAGADFIDGRGGTDTLSYASSATGLYIDLENRISWDGSSMDGFLSMEKLVGSSHADLIIGSSGADVIDSGAGSDEVRAGDGDDLVLASVGGDVLDGGLGIDTLSFAGSSRGIVLDLGTAKSWDGAAMSSFSGFEKFIGSGLRDYLIGDSGDNDLDGGGGADNLTGGAGNDIFRFRSEANGGVEAITDFTSGQDKIAITGSNYLHSFADVQSYSFQSGSTLYISTGAGSIAVLNTTIADLSASDFIFF